MTNVQVTQVKGSMLQGFVKAIKADKSGQCRALLSDDASQLIEDRILPAYWYPFDAYKSCFKAVCKVNGQSDPEILRQFGRQSGEETMSAIYRTALDKDDALGVMNSFRVIGQTVYDRISIDSEMIADNRIRITVTDFDPDFEEWYLVGRGWMEKTLELAMKKPIHSEIVEKSWEGAPATVYEMSWA
jgi:hypothetical protein